MAGGYFTNTLFEEDTTKQTIPQEAPPESVCGGAVQELHVDTTPPIESDN